ncbi:unnamed protein product [Bathycoccus prasinos]
MQNDMNESGCVVVEVCGGAITDLSNSFRASLGVSKSLFENYSFFLLSFRHAKSSIKSKHI